MHMLTVHPLKFRVGTVYGGIGDSYFLLLLSD